jgi:hypothetical protein
MDAIQADTKNFAKYGFESENQMISVQKILMDRIRGESKSKVEALNKIEENRGWGNALTSFQEQLKQGYSPEAFATILDDNLGQWTAEAKVTLDRIELADEKRAKEIRDAWDYVVDSQTQMFETITGGLDSLLSNMNFEAWDGLKSLVKDGVKVASDLFLHDPKPKAKRDWSASVRRASRGDGAAKHLNPKYRMYVLRGGAGAGVVEPLEENYHGGHILNGGQT